MLPWMTAVEEKPLPIGEEFRIPGELQTTKQLFRTATVSDSNLLCLKPEGVERKFWDYGRIAASSSNLFRLKVMDLPQVASKKKNDASQTGVLETAASQGEPGRSVAQPATSATLDADAAAAVEENPPKRADRYFQLLMKRHNQRIQAGQKQALADEQERAEGAAKQALEACIAQAKRALNKTNSSEQHQPMKEAELKGLMEESDFGPLTAYNGALKIEIEIVVTRAPGEVWDSLSDMGNDHGSAASENSSRPSTPPIDFGDDLAKLAEEMKDHTKGKGGDDEADDDQKPKLANIWKNPHPKWTLDLGGSVFFVPDAERYAHAPSMPPPPPPSLQGRRRMRLKPRLPLEISNHRYRDEHPNIWPPDPYSPQVTDYTSFQQKMLTLDFYKSCSEGLAQLPPQQREEDRYRQEQEFGDFIMKSLRRSAAWEGWRKHEHERDRAQSLAQPERPVEQTSAKVPEQKPSKKAPASESKATMPVGRPNYKPGKVITGSTSAPSVHL